MDNSGEYTPVSPESTVGDLYGTKPITDRDSMMVMLRGERGDPIRIDCIVNRHKTGFTIPGKFSILRRVTTYYGPELLLDRSGETNSSKYLLTAPGPDKFLHLWVSETDEDGYRIGWNLIAEVKSSFEEGLPQYSICSKCGEPIKSLEHERMAALEQCG